MFDDESYIVNLTDGASAYTQKIAGILQHFAVDHQEKEWTMAVEALFDVSADTNRPTFAGTNTIDPFWKRAKSKIPQGISYMKQRALRVAYLRSGRLECKVT